MACSNCVRFVGVGYFGGGNGMSDKSSSSGGIGFTGLLCVLFVGLKLTGYIDWSWWWVTSPLWLPIVIILPIAFLIVLFQTIRGR
jgi:uncharacterized protein (DUF983 family)